MELENIPEVTPLCFFDAKIAIPQKKKGKFNSSHLLPNYEDLNDSEHFAEVYMAWDEEGLDFQFVVNQPFQMATYPDYQRKDCIELFIHTRSESMSRYFNKFSHHFLVFPVKVSGIHGMEITKFRGEDQHELCLPERLKVEADLEKKRYLVNVTLSKNELYGFDPQIAQEIRVNYRIHRYQNEPQIFFLGTLDQKDHHLSLWPKIQLIKS